MPPWPGEKASERSEKKAGPFFISGGGDGQPSILKSQWESSQESIRKKDRQEVRHIPCHCS